MNKVKFTSDLKRLIATLTLGLVLVGCGEKDKTSVISKEENSSSSSVTTSIAESELIMVEEFDYFESEKEEIRELLESDQVEEVKEKGKEYFIKGVDFVFYGTEISGVTFDELTEEGKQQTIKNLEIIDGWIETIVPNYKENIEEKYLIVKDFLNDKYYVVLDSVRNYLGDENYEAVVEIKNQIKGDLSDTKDKVLAKIENWYQGFKES